MSRPRVLAGLLLVLGFSPAPADHEIADGMAVATFGGGCFWCMEPPYDELEGVISTTSGFMGGRVSNPSYEQVVRGNTGHAEVVQVVYDPSVIGYQRLLEVFWRNIDPLTENGQFCDKGPSYRPVIFAHDEQQRSLAEASKRALVEGARFDEPIVVPIEDATAFWPAEEYHQDYYQKNPVRYNYYRWRCGREQRLDELWGKGPIE